MMIECVITGRCYVFVDGIIGVNQKSKRSTITLGDALEAIETSSRLVIEPILEANEYRCTAEGKDIKNGITTDMDIAFQVEFGSTLDTAVLNKLGIKNATTKMCFMV